MVDYESRDLICLYLDARGDAQEVSPAPAAVTAAGIGDALEADDTAATRIQLLDELSTLQDEGLVTTETRPVTGYDTPRPVYELTDEGREYATRIRQRVSDESVVVTNGTSEEVPLGEIDRYFEEATAPLATALARLTDSGEVPLHRHVGEQFVDRQDPLATVTDTIETSFTHESRTAIVGGPAGIGKTALVRQAIDSVREDYDDLVTARGNARTEPTGSYEPLRQAFETVPAGEAVLATLRAARTAEPLDDPDDLDARRQALFDDVADEVRTASLTHPIVLFVDNLQWADEATLELFAHLATSIDELLYPVAFVGTYRTPAVAGAADHPLTAVLDRLQDAGPATEIQLDALTRADTRALLAGVVGRQRLPEDFVAAVHDRTGGNPLFARETATHLLETDRIDPSAPAFPTEPGELELPEGVTDQIDRRLDHLDEPSRELLRLGALIGEHIPGGVLAEAVDIDSPQFREYVDVLVASRIWAPADEPPVASDATASGEVATADGSGGLRFVSGALREAVVERLPDAVASEYHQRVADAFVAVYGSDLAERAARVAHHYDEAGDHELAVRYYRQAGDHAKETYATENATAQYERALTLASAEDDSDDAAVAAIHAELADAYRIRSAYDKARETVREGLTIATADSREACRLLGIQARAQAAQSDFSQGRETASRQHELATELEARDLEARALRTLGKIAEKQGDYEDARAHHEQSLTIYRAIGDSHGEANSLSDLGLVAYRQGAFEQARDYHEQGLALSREIDDRRGEAGALLNLGLVAYREGAYEDAREYFQQSLTIYRDVGDRYGEANSLGNLGLVARRQGAYEDAREYHQQSLAIKQDIGNRRGAATSLTNLGLVARRQGSSADALQFFQQALAIYRDVGDTHGEARILGNLGMISGIQGAYGEAQEYFQESLAINRDIGDRQGEANSLNNLGKAAYRQGAFEQAREYHEQCLTIYRDIGNRRGQAGALLNLGKATVRDGANEQARKYLEQSLEIARDLEATDKEADALATLGELERLQGEYDRARERLDRALELGESLDAEQRIAESQLAFARLELARGNVGTARERGRKARQRFDELDATHWVGRSRRLLGRVSARSGESERARQHWQAALDTFTEIDAPHDALETLQWLVEHCREAGDDDAAREFVARAQDVLAEAPDATIGLYREWVQKQAGELGV